jgi:hypothetical protein
MYIVRCAPMDPSAHPLQWEVGGEREWNGRTPTFLPCSRNARSEKAPVGRAHTVWTETTQKCKISFF